MSTKDVSFSLTETNQHRCIHNGRNHHAAINPSGGLIGCGHPVGASGARMFLDLYKQVTGTAGAYQVEGVKNGMMLIIGGSATTNYVFIVGAEQ